MIIYVPRFTKRTRKEIWLKSKKRRIWLKKIESRYQTLVTLQQNQKKQKNTYTTEDQL